LAENALGTVLNLKSIALDGDEGRLSELLYTMSELALLSVAAVAILDPVLANFSFVKALRHRGVVVGGLVLGRSRAILCWNEGFALYGGVKGHTLVREAAGCGHELSNVEVGGVELLGLNLYYVHCLDLKFL
jgi:hypothetical protein